MPKCCMENPERCIKQSALIAVKNVKFRSDLILTGWFIVGTVGQREEDLDISFHVCIAANSNLRHARKAEKMGLRKIPPL